MGDSSKRAGRVARPRLSYANVVATLALFVALGGSSYAAVEISGSQIRDRSVPGTKLVVHAVGLRELNLKGVVVPKATVSDRTADLLVPAPRSRRHLTGRAAGDQPCATGSLVVLSVGQSCVLFAKGPFTVTAHCIDKGGGDYAGALWATSTVDGWYIFGGFPTSPLPAATVSFLTWDASSPNDEVIGGPGPLITVPGGTTLSFTYVRMFVHQPFADCGIATNAIG